MFTYLIRLKNFRHSAMKKMAMFASPKIKHEKLQVPVQNCKIPRKIFTFINQLFEHLSCCKQKGLKKTLKLKNGRRSKVRKNHFEQDLQGGNFRK